MDVAVPAQNFLRCTFTINRIALSIVGAWFLPFEILHIFLQINQNKQIFQLQLQPGFVQKHSNVPSAGVARNVSFATSQKQA